MTAKPGTGRNPYRPGAAATPLFLAGRDDARRRFASTLSAAPELPANVRLTGLRGVGKTVLLKEFEQDGEQLDWITSRIQLEPRHNQEVDLTALIVGLAQQAVQKTSRSARIRTAIRGAADAVRGALTVTMEDVQFSIDPAADVRQRDLVAALYETIDVAVSHGFRGYLLLLDEAQVLRDDRDRSGEHPLSLLIAAVNTLQEKELPIALTMCGLPSLSSNLLKARTYSERMFRGEELGRLSMEQAHQAFSRPLDDADISVDPELVMRVIEEVEGYPYFIQLWGAELWDAAHAAGIRTFDTRLLDEVEPEIYQRLDRDFYRGRLDALTPAESDLLLATASCPYPPLRTVDIHSQSQKTEANVNVLMGRLAEQGVVFRLQKGQYAYTAPKFHGYLQRRRAKLDAADGASSPR